MGASTIAPTSHEVSAAIGADRPEIWVPGEHDEPRDPHDSHDLRGESLDEPARCSKCQLLDTSPQIEGVCRGKAASRSRRTYSAAQVWDALETAWLACFCRPGVPQEGLTEEWVEAVVYAAIDALKATPKAA